ncbi:MAG: DUF432 domain-containing protein [Methanomicrobiaceae archaeon]|nr:DUF432 domain-containing protein [Methanomicrobiaceae archaeon]
MFGSYGYSFEYSNHEISAGLVRDGPFVRYFREVTGRARVEKIISSDSGRVVVNPVEPLNLPEKVTNFLELEFDPIFLEPLGNKGIFLEFPVEIGVFIASKQDIEVLDIFSLDSPKYSLYGPPNGGVITRWLQSPVHSEIPALDHHRRGVLRLTLENTTKEWQEISRVVLEGTLMKIYYGEVEGKKLVSMYGRVRIQSKLVAETEFFDHPVAEGMNKSVEIYTAREIPGMKRSFPMEWGLV